MGRPLDRAHVRHGQGSDWLGDRRENICAARPRAVLSSSMRAAVSRTPMGASYQRGSAADRTWRVAPRAPAPRRPHRARDVAHALHRASSTTPLLIEYFALDLIMYGACRGVVGYASTTGRCPLKRKPRARDGGSAASITSTSPTPSRDGCEVAARGPAAPDGVRQFHPTGVYGVRRADHRGRRGEVVYSPTARAIASWSAMRPLRRSRSRDVVSRRWRPRSAKAAASASTGPISFTST